MDDAPPTNTFDPSARAVLDHAHAGARRDAGVFLRGALVALLCAGCSSTAAAPAPAPAVAAAAAPAPALTATPAAALRSGPDDARGGRLYDNWCSEMSRATPWSSRGGFTPQHVEMPTPSPESALPVTSKLTRSLPEVYVEGGAIVMHREERTRRGWKGN